MYKVSLHTRIISFTVAIVTVTSVLLAFGVLTLKNRLEEETFGRMVQDQMDYFLQTENATISQAEMLAGWELRRGESASGLPAQISQLPPGSHHSVRVDDAYFQVEVAERNGEKIYLTYDLTAWEEQEHEVLGILAYGALLILLAAILVAHLSSKASLRPLNALTERLAGIQPDQRDIRISSEFTGHEVHSIAREFDRYLKRLDEFVEREKFISTAASHELRTPLSIIIGAVDVIEANAIDPGNSRALARIRRACDDMLAFVEATLFLSRENSKLANQGEPTALHGLINELIEDLYIKIKQRCIEVSNQVSPTLVVYQPSSILKIVVGNIFRNAVEHTQDGNIAITMSENLLKITDTGEGIAPENLARVFDQNFTTKTTGFGMGLTLVRKLCDRLGWNLTIDSSQSGGTTVTVAFDAQTLPAQQSA